MNAAEPKKSIARSVGEFFGYIVSGVKADPGATQRTEINRTVEEEDRGDVVLRRTIVEEVELKGGADTDPSNGSQERHG